MQPLVYFIIFLILTVFLNPTQAMPRDKVLHFSVSMSGQIACAALVTATLEKPAANILCAVGMSAAGIAVEYGIAGPNTKSAKDIAANTAGIAIGATIVQLKF